MNTPVLDAPPGSAPGPRGSTRGDDGDPAVELRARHRRPRPAPVEEALTGSGHPVRIDVLRGAPPVRGRHDPRLSHRHARAAPSAASSWAPSPSGLLAPALPEL